MFTFFIVAAFPHENTSSPALPQKKTEKDAQKVVFWKKLQINSLPGWKNSSSSIYHGVVITKINLHRETLWRRWWRWHGWWRRETSSTRSKKWSQGTVCWYVVCTCFSRVVSDYIYGHNFLLRSYFCEHAALPHKTKPLRLYRKTKIRVYIIITPI